MKILITGSNGLLGQKLVSLLYLKPEITLIATARGANRDEIYEDYIYESMDITSEENVLKVFRKHKPDAVIHTAAMTHVDQCELNKEACVDQNITSVKHIVKACKEVGAFLLHVSTDFIFDGTRGPLTEEEIPNPVNYYGWTKWEAEKAVENSGLKWAIARTVLVFGVVQDMSRSNIVLWVKNNLEQKKEINVVNDQWRTPTLAEDLAMGCWLIVKNQAEGIFNISGEEMLSPYELAHKVADVWKLDKGLIKQADSSTFTQPALRPPKTGFIIDKAKKQLGYKPHTLEEGLDLLKEQLT
ncbi:SDR family oxidoreductase [Cytophaga hutchinsonii]|uniref:dTDP-4-dehydrorhamnose reductase n=1 Tax=Cytophaga hutchinsonii (strain ATCC 33406 / DSM 1761 / CIP 103989 / NBRC 15051 / NCIMB 9469 / D465) TaxID=269798 RepID=A0A6N4SNC8_CYTH3|nr:SDR family oxidoreductase [Cytophaga hutchinsonii]ABG57783.1 dTDP-4-dehydrorhamnose reductase [Cytophaga hutchinsonii ATCC 33406]SFX05438.1 dTDP-4-dehydrorhamnose reductase [Cytophaga hutchinsonii ATCC 33406]